MPAPFVTGVGTVASGAAGIVPGLPAEVWDADLFLMFLESQDTTAVPAVTGWADVAASPVYVSTGTPTRLTCRWQRAVAGQAAPTVPDAGDHLIGAILGIRGAAMQSNPWNITAAATDLTATTAVSIPGATTTLPDCLVVVAVSTGTDTATAQVSGGTFTNANLVGLTTRVNNWVIAGGGGGLAVASGTFAGPGAYGATTATLLTANFKACLSIAIRPAQMLAVPVPTISRPVG
jgi:hypothetical protein